MGLVLPAATRPQDLQNPAFMGKVLKEAKTTPSTGTVTDASFADRGGNTLIGRAAGTSGKPADIGLAEDQFLVNRDGTLVGDILRDADIPATISRDTEVAAAFSAHDADSGAHAILSATAQFVLAGELFT